MCFCFPPPGVAIWQGKGRQIPDHLPGAVNRVPSDGPQAQHRIPHPGQVCCLFSTFLVISVRLILFFCSAIYEVLKGGASDTVSFVTDKCEPDQPAPPKLGNRSKTSICVRWDGNHAWMVYNSKVQVLQVLTNWQLQWSFWLEIFLKSSLGYFGMETIWKFNTVFFAQPLSKCLHNKFNIRWQQGLLDHFCRYLYSRILSNCAETYEKVFRNICFRF